MSYISHCCVHLYVTITLADTSRFKKAVASRALPHSWRHISVRHTSGFQHFSQQSRNAFHVGTAKNSEHRNMPTSLPDTILKNWRLIWSLNSRHHTAAHSTEETTDKYQFTVQAWRWVCFAYNEWLERSYIPLLSWLFLKTELSSF